MSKLTGGLFSRPSGKNSGLVFSSARTSRGKRATARNYVIPTQPGTSAQLLTKQKMAGVAEIYRKLPEQIRKHDLKNLPGAVSGYTALSKILMPVFGYPIPPHPQKVFVNLGSLPVPRRMETFRSQTLSLFQPRWSTEIEGGASADDKMSYFYIAIITTSSPEDDIQVVSGVDVADRSDGGIDIPLEGFFPIGGLAFYYFRSNQTGELSQAILQQPMSSAV